jgi:hypothetical protein
VMETDSSPLHLSRSETVRQLPREDDEIPPGAENGLNDRFVQMISQDMLGPWGVIGQLLNYNRHLVQAREQIRDSGVFIVTRLRAGVSSSSSSLACGP